MNQKPKRLYKSRRNRMIDGVCGGFAEYLDVDPTIVRILWVLVACMGGAGILLYIAGMIIMPVNPEHVVQTVPPAAGELASAEAVSGSDARKFWGVLLVIVGVVILFSNLGFFHWFYWWNFSWSVVFPVILILAGAALIYYRISRAQVSTGATVPEAEGAQTAPPRAVRELRRSKTDKKMFGVCGGLAKYLEIDSTVVRIVFVILTLASFGIGILLYLAMALVTPVET